MKWLNNYCKVTKNFSEMIGEPIKYFDGEKLGTFYH